MKISKWKLAFSGLTFVLFMPTLGWALSGCLVSDGTKLIVDVNCECDQKKECATFPKVKYDDKFFNSRNVKNKPLFSDKLKTSYKESYDLFNTIVQLKAAGEGHSEKIKNVYSQLATLNQEIKAQIIKEHPGLAAQIKKAHIEKNKFKVEHSEKNIQNIRPPAESHVAVEPAEQIIPLEKQANTAAPIANLPVASGGNSMAEKDKIYILKNLDKKDYQRNEDDSLFEIVGKAYKRSGYKKLLTP